MTFKILAVFALLAGAFGLAPIQAQEAAPAPLAADDAATSGGNTLFGKPFMLSADFTELALEEGEVTDLDARVNVILEMEDLIIQSGQLKYSSVTQIMRGFRDEEKQCKIVQTDSTIYCDTFVYNTETGSMEPDGTARTELRTGNQDIEITSETQTIEKDPTTGETRAKFENNVIIKSKGFQPRSKYDSDEKILIIGDEKIPDAPQ